MLKSTLRFGYDLLQKLKKFNVLVITFIWKLIDWWHWNMGLQKGNKPVKFMSPSLPFLYCKMRMTMFHLYEALLCLRHSVNYCAILTKVGSPESQRRSDVMLSVFSLVSFQTKPNKLWFLESYKTYVSFSFSENDGLLVFSLMRKVLG